MMGNLADEPEVKWITQRVASLGVLINNYVDKVIKVYKRPKDSVAGFDFDCSNTRGLIFALTLNSKFGLDNRAEIPGYLATELSTGISFREVNPRDSLHFEISKLTVNLHLDSVSVVAGRDEHGYIIYQTGNLLQHLVNDHLNKPRVIAPNLENGFVFGYRFNLFGG